MRYILLIILSLTYMLDSNAQLRRDFSQIYRNAPYINPAFTGIEDYFEINSGLQQSWSAMDDNQASVFVSAYGRIGNYSPTVYEKNALRVSDPSRFRDIAASRKDIYRKHGIGGRLTSLSIGPLVQQNFMLSYSYHIPLSTKLMLSFGTNLAIDRQVLNLDTYTLRNEADDQFYQELLRQGDGVSTFFNAGFGTVLYNDRFFTGFSARSIVNSTVKNSLEVETLEPSAVYTFMGGMMFPLGPDLILRPGLKMDYSEFYDLAIQPNLSLRWKHRLSIGTYYAVDKALTLTFALQLSDRLRLGYSYDHFVADLGLLNRNNHEITLSFFVNNKYGIASYLW
ncbi:PorP/SprF family type IX secretion system membrane protein [Fulvivirga sedimenti]|uniref:PorP/SprF family type IX secretion system membrane protein n=1 Tax=Fulvivirga sedimenti TaxID=2879465 RepID=A0A9X1HUZ7_9BACT|nr:PorP/SprF family type IX secretion system membrane protein [Fulvivirga sedimenti]MCA6078763.1 PorP/SprF family type IX secretion system membrane protein [Fulvivirga sedimenti]